MFSFFSSKTCPPPFSLSSRKESSCQSTQSCSSTSADTSPSSKLPPQSVASAGPNREDAPRFFSATPVGLPIVSNDDPSSSLTAAVDADQVPEINQLLGSMIALIVAQGRAIKASEQKDLTFQTLMDQKLNLLTGRVATLRAIVGSLPPKSRYNDRLQFVDKRLRAVEDGVQDLARASGPKGKAILRDGIMMRNPGDKGSSPHAERFFTLPISFDSLNSADVNIRIDDEVPSCGLMDYDDSTVQISITPMTPTITHGGSQTQITSAALERDLLPFNQVGLSLVDRAIQAEREKLGDASVLAEGENTVGFHVRKRVVKKRKRDTFELDMGFLDNVSIDENAIIQNNDPYEAYMNASQLSSGIEDLPESLPSRSASTIPDTMTTRQRGKAGENGWIPFPTQMLRQKSVSVSPSFSSADSEDSHLTADRRGVSLVEDKLLAPGGPSPSKKKGKKGGKRKKRKRGSVWPAFGPNTVKTRMEEVVCDNCSGRVHYACAGPLRGKDMNKEPWSCPDCIWILTHAFDDEEVEIPEAQQERCLREDCIYRSATKIVRKNDDDNEFFMEKIVGRKRLRWEANGEATYVYLVKWYDWALYDSTWEPRSNIPNIKRQEALFLQELRRQGTESDPREKVVLLPEVERWFDHKGQYRIDVLEGLGIDKRCWWET
ncbi:hypothetical protein I316_01811 [Kwoniella heveanensis BCC8398]|uniref:Chromo domain-containing protein n=1 Tax=Kwoniella heveanensis BCC8398 TaxID=1296120 RepID=A0A1B9GZW1_9TREE|nr:hypothetical protein I316_01811 [Kwoniella heveanensis BCC8398]